MSDSRQRGPTGASGQETIKESRRLRLLEQLLNNRRVWRDAAGLLLSAFGLITLITLLGWNVGGIISAWTGFLQHAFGVGSIVLCLIFIFLGIPLVLNTHIQFDASLLIQIIAFEITFITLLALIHSLSIGVDGYELSKRGSGGGIVGWVLARIIWIALGSEEGIARLISVIVWFVLLMISGVVAFRPLLMATPSEDAEHLIPTRTAPTSTANLAPTQTRHISATRSTQPTGVIPAQESILEEPPPVTGAALPGTVSPTKAKPELWSPAGATRPGAGALLKSKATIVKPEEAKTHPATVAQKQVKALPHDQTLPPISLLKAIKEAKGGDADVRRQADIIETTLAQFGLVGKVVEIRRGPTITQFGVEPGYLEKTGPSGEKRQQKIRVGQIASLQNDLALALSAASIRIEAPIPGRGLIGIEVPNASVSMVDLRGMLESETYQTLRSKSPLAIALGRDVSGTAVSADLSRMPHVLIAGTTGSGKSVCISTIAVSLCMNNRPEELKLVLIDPKMVELTRFTGLPHIIGKPESEMDRIPGVLRWVTKEMDTRYKQFAEVGARNLADFNESAVRRGEEPLPRIVLLIDELADLMLQSPIETERTICRLAQMARATGIHMVVATQRPSVDVVTGLIKANFPARISFTVASSTDSRVILDQVGAESLLGRGDMLFLNPEAGHPQRLQGCFVSDKEVDALIAWWQKQMEIEKSARQEEEPETGGKTGTEDEYVANKKPEFDTPWEMTVAEMAAERISNSPNKSSGSAKGNNGSEEDSEDELVKRALDIIKASGNVSTSLLQRKLRIGYPRAARLMEELQEMGIVGAASRQAGKGREVKRGDDED